mmetsp:Transcript_17605/g.59160  ORF Transcript_17605/g.59160 Transcript_17605/m.59160 type:complete len:311 (+) Transcript_17605:36-968(+)
MPRAALLRAARRAALTSGAALAAGSAALTSCADAPSLVTDWSSPEKAKQLEVSYQRAEVRAQRAAMIAMLRPETGERILDVGCGPGYLVAQLAAAVGPEGRVEGVDPSEAMVRMARARATAEAAASSAVHVGPGEAGALPYPDATFDAVVLSQVLLYVPDVPAALREARRVLRPGGRLLICETDWDSLIVHTDDVPRLEKIRAAAVTTFLDAHLPPRLPGLLHEAGLALGEASTVPMLSAGVALPESFMGHWAFHVAAEKARAAGMDERDVAGWLQEQQDRSRDGAFFACVHRFLFLAWRPPRDGAETKP